MNNANKLRDATLPEKIKWLRKHSPKTQDNSKKGYYSIEKVAEESGISVGLLSKAENLEEGKTLYYTTLIEIADYYDVSLDWLCCRSNAEDIDYNRDYVKRYTGLSEASLVKIVKWKNQSEIFGSQLPFLSSQHPMFNKLLEDERIDELLEVIFRYCVKAKKCLEPIDDNERINRINPLFNADSEPTREELKDAELFKAQRVLTDIIERIGAEYEQKES